MASILLKVVRIFNSQLKCNYLKNKKLFLIFVFDFWILDQILNILKEKVIVIANVFPKLQTVRIFVRKRSQEHRFRTGFGSQHVKVSELLAKSSWECFDHIFFIILSEVDLENVSPSVSRNLRSVCEHIDIRSQVSYSRLWEFGSPNWNAIVWKTKKFFWSFYCIVSKLSQEHRFRTGFGSQHVEASRLLFKSKWEPFDHVLLSFSGKCIWKMSPLVLGEILGVFVNALTSNIKYPVQDCENLQLYLKSNYLEKKHFFSVFCSISVFCIKFWIFWKKRWLSSLI